MRKTLTIISLVAGWIALAISLNSNLLASIQLIGLGLGCLVSCRIIQHWPASRNEVWRNHHVSEQVKYRD